MIKLSVNGLELSVPAGLTVLQACELAGEEIPRFCYHERLSVAGNCRMCLVEIHPSGARKLQASCAVPVAEGMHITTNSAFVRQAREGMMEFLLINHPLDCPICDQGGECDLQDQALGYGKNSSSYQEPKRAVSEKYMGPLIKTVMTRCIHCTRCVRFASEIAGTHDIGLVHRGEDAEITSLERSVRSELSGNLIDLCPVGALTSRPYAFQARSWELSQTNSIDVWDGMGSNIRIDTRGNEVMRVLPRLNEAINEEWISDKVRFAYDGLRLQRLDRPWRRVPAKSGSRGAKADTKTGRFEAISWPEALGQAVQCFEQLKPEQIAVVLGDQVEAETLFSVKLLAEKLGIPSVDCRQDGARLTPGTEAGAAGRSAYLFNSGFENLEQCDALLVVGANLRHEAPVLNARLRRVWLSGHLQVAYIGEELETNFTQTHLGTGLEALELLAEGKGGGFVKAFRSARYPALILGSGVFTRPDIQSILSVIGRLVHRYRLRREGWNGYNVLHRAASRVAGLDLGLVPGSRGYAAWQLPDAIRAGRIKLLWLIGADEFNFTPKRGCFVMYQGHHGDTGAHRADLILPGAAWCEKTGLYINSEGRVQMAHRALFPPGEAREDWKILYVLARQLGVSLDWTDLTSLRQALYRAHPHFRELAVKPEAMELPPFPEEEAEKASSLSRLDEPFCYPLKAFYRTDPISRHSVTMAKCTAELAGQPGQSGAAA